MTHICILAFITDTVCTNLKDIVIPHKQLSHI